MISERDLRGPDPGPRLHSDQGRLCEGGDTGRHLGQYPSLVLGIQ